MPHPLRRLLAPRSPPILERDVTSLVLHDGRTIDIQRVRNPRARRLRLSVDERGARLTLPPRASLVSGERFLAEHREWLAETHGVVVGLSTIWKALKHFKLTLKKSRSGPPNKAARTLPRPDATGLPANPSWT